MELQVDNLNFENRQLLLLACVQNLIEAYSNVSALYPMGPLRPVDALQASAELQTDNNKSFDFEMPINLCTKQCDEIKKKAEAITPSTASITQDDLGNFHNYGSLSFHDTPCSSTTDPQNSVDKTSLLPGAHLASNTNFSHSPKKVRRLWQFLRDLLSNPDYNPRIIKWVSREQKIFQLTQSSTVAKLWGQQKHKPNMSYNNLGRSLRYYYSRNILRKVSGQRLAYQFIN